MDFIQTPIWQTTIMFATPRGDMQVLISGRVFKLMMKFKIKAGAWQWQNFALQAKKHKAVPMSLFEKLTDTFLKQIFCKICCIHNYRMLRSSTKVFIASQI